VRDLGDFLAQGGAIVGGGAASATIAFIAGSVIQDFRPETDPDSWARKGAAYGGLVGLVALAERGVVRNANRRTRNYVTWR
jgi:hypothetical protein